MTDPLQYPIQADVLLRKKKSIRRTLLEQPGLVDKRIAILGGSTTAEVRDMLELFLLKDGIRPVFYESQYGRYHEDAMFPNTALSDFAPQAIYIHTSNVNISRYPALTDSADDVDHLVNQQVGKFTGIWDRLSAGYGCPIIQNNFEMPHYRGLGNLDAYDIHGRSRFVAELNQRFSAEAHQRSNLYLHDIHYLSAWFGLERWYDQLAWHAYKYAMSLDAMPQLANGVASIVKAIAGRSRKCLVLDLDNTLWGGVIGDDGLGGIQIGKETPEAEAYTEFQRYLKALKERGVILAVCSKNDDANARQGFSHPDSVLALADFSAFQANWEAKDANIRRIAQALNIGLDAMVFADDNPRERDIVRAQLPQVTVPELGADVAKYIDILDKTGLFETVSLVADDLRRSDYYAGNAARQELAGRFESYDEFLVSLQMVAEIQPLKPLYLDRVTQLTNKTNQFNVTTRRYTLDEVTGIAGNPDCIALYGRLQDKFGDNGLVTVVFGHLQNSELHIDLWLMSCRVLKRGMETAMLDALVRQAAALGAKALVGYYFPTAKNGMVRDLFKDMGFAPRSQTPDGASTWCLDIAGGYANKNLFIKVNP